MESFSTSFLEIQPSIHRAIAGMEVASDVTSRESGEEHLGHLASLSQHLLETIPSFYYEEE